MANFIVCDDHPIFRYGLKLLLDEMYPGSHIFEAGDMPELESAIARTVPDLILLDIFLPGLDPEVSLQSLRRRFPQLGILIVSMLTKRSAVERLFIAGANGFVAKTIERENIRRSVRDVRAGKRPIYLPPQTRSGALRPEDNPTDFLPPRQAQVLHLICLGMSNKEIAVELALSASTVRAHVSALFTKISVSNRTEAASYGIRLGLLAYTGSHRHYCDLIGPERDTETYPYPQRTPFSPAHETIKS